MKEAHGDIFLLYIVMFFLVLIVTFTAIIANIAFRFRVKNGIINIIEQADYANNQTEAQTLADEYAARVHYQYAGTFTCSGYSSGYGYCIEESSTYNNQVTYKVTVYLDISLPIFDVLPISIPIGGETKTFEKLNP